MSEHKPEPRRERSSFVWPIILIVIGVVFLLDNLGLLGRHLWDNIWQLWPILLVAIGLDSLFRRNEIAGPVFMIGLGVAFLLGTAGLIGWGVWDVLWRFWPLLLVAVGLEIMFGRRSLILSFLSVIVIIVILGGAVWMYGVRPASADRLEGESVQQVLGDIERANIRIVNPGSAGQPRDGGWPSYAVYDTHSGSVKIKRVPYDINGLMEDIKTRRDQNRYLVDILHRIKQN